MFATTGTVTPYPSQAEAVTGTSERVLAERSSKPELSKQSSQSSERKSSELQPGLRRKSTVSKLIQSGRGAGNEAVRKTKKQLAYERFVMGSGHHAAKKGFVDMDTGYRQERASAFSFCFQFPDIICKLKGSVLPKIQVEIFIATTLGVLCAQYWQDHDHYGNAAHSVAGTLLAFLVVFRSNIAWNMYLSGYTAIFSIRTTAVNLSNVILSTLIAKSAEMGKPLPPEAHELIRLLKLYFFLVVEHVRSSQGEGAWMWSQNVAYSFARPHEILELTAEVRA